ncbi:MAG TPA: YciI family protein [Longimicrobiaceae bacterium]|jgi:hypothetical protein|nr:YciI family protein [Longimicrobiaceae bacterium]
MRFMMLYKPGSDQENAGPPSPECMAALGQLVEEMTARGAMIANDGLQASSKGARVRIDDGKVVVTDGPFTETKELIAGYAIMEAADKAEAIEFARRFITVMGEGETEVRQMHDAAGGADDCAAAHLASATA